MIKLHSKETFLIFVMYFCSASLFFVSSSLAQSFRKPNIHLEVKIKDKVIAEKDTASIKLGEKIQLQVSKKRFSDSREVVNVTTDKKIHYQVLTPWSLTVNQEGLLEGKYPSRTDKIPANNSSNRGLLIITYGNIGGDEVGSQFVNFFVDFSGTSKSLPVNDTSQPVSSTHDVHNVEKADIENSKAAPVSKPFDFSTMDAFKQNIPADVLESLNNPEIQPVNADGIDNQEDGDVDNADPAVSSDEQQEDLSTMDSESSESEDAASENQEVDFIDYDQLRKMQKIRESIPATKPQDPLLNLTPEERRLYDDALKQP